MTYNASNPKSLTLSGKYFSSLLVLPGLVDHPMRARRHVTAP